MANDVLAPPSAREPQQPPRAGDVVVTVLFALLLLAPAALALAGRYGADAEFITHHEMRSPFVAPPPSSGALATGGWERDAERQIADGFPLRRNLIEAYDLAKYFAFGSVASSHVTRGRDGWLFYAAEERDYDDGTYAPTDAQLAATADVYEARAAWCARRGIAYAFVLAPNKSTAYSRYLPPWVRHVTPPAGARLIALLRARAVRAVDLRSVEIAAAATADDVYSKGDTHWTDVGAYIAYRAIVREFGIHDEIASGSIVRNTAVEPGDLDRLAGIGSAVPNRTVRFTYPHRAHDPGTPSHPQDPDANAQSHGARATGDRRLPRAALFGDSFLIAVAPFLAEDFSRTVFVERDPVHGISRSVIEAEKPSIVIEEIVERSLAVAPPAEP